MIYLDHAATTRPHEDVVTAMVPYLETQYHNPSGQYATEAADGLNTARERVATLIGTTPDSIVFTGGGSEADNLALKGIVGGRDGGHVVTSTIEHPAIEESCRWLERRGIDVTRISPRTDGRIDPRDVQDAIRSETVLLSIMHANNETGVIQPIEEIAAICHEHDVFVHSDTVQTAGKLPLDVEEIGLDMASLSAHKFYGPKGVGALYLKDGIARDLEPLIHGGGQEGGLRSGTENVPGIVGMGVAAERAWEDLDERRERLSALRDEFVRTVQRATDGVLIGHPEKRLPGYALFCFEGVAGSHLVEELAERDIAVSSGSACHSGTPSPSTVLTEMGVGIETALGAARFSMGRKTTASDVERTVTALEATLEHLRT